VRWLVASVVLSVALTVVLNVGLRMFPGTADRVARRHAEAMTTDTDDARRTHRGVRVIVPWKTMIVGSLILTVVVNILLRMS
jgi:hypothetical protein